MEISTAQSQLSQHDWQSYSDSNTQANSQVKTSSACLGMVTEADRGGYARPNQFCGCPGPVQRVWDMGMAVIRGIENLAKAITVIWSPPRPTVPAPPQNPPVVIESPPAQPAPTECVPPAETNQPAPTEQPTPTPTPQSLVPTHARIFEYTGNSEWRPGKDSQNAFLNLRKNLYGDVDKIEILSPDGTTVIATGRFEKRLEDGRPRYRFDTKGANIPEGAIIKATLKVKNAGQEPGVRYIEIPKPGQKFVF